MLHADCYLHGSYCDDFARWNLPNETGLEWIDAKGIIYSEELKSDIPDEAIQILDAILRNFEEAFDDSSKNEVWTHEAMKGHGFWNQQRALAMSILNAVQVNI